MRSTGRRQSRLRRALAWNADISYPTLRRRRPGRYLDLQFSLRMLLCVTTVLSVWLAVWRNIAGADLGRDMIEALFITIPTLLVVRSANGWRRLRVSWQVLVCGFIYLGYLLLLALLRNYFPFVAWSGMSRFI
jgi:hypothetical protein